MPRTERKQRRRVTEVIGSPMRRGGDGPHGQAMLGTALVRRRSRRQIDHILTNRNRGVVLVSRRVADLIFDHVLRTSTRSSVVEYRRESSNDGRSGSKAWEVAC